MMFTELKNKIRGLNEIKTLSYNQGDEKYYNTEILGKLAFPKQRDIYSIGVISFILVFGMIVPLKSPDVHAFNLLKSKNGWCNRPNWRDLNRYLKDKGELPSSNRLLKDFLCKLLSKCGFSATELLKHDWLTLHTATKEEIINYAMLHSLIKDDAAE
jgi:serine/threonine protein kinase